CERCGELEGSGIAVLTDASVAGSNPFPASVTGGRDETSDESPEGFLRLRLQRPFDPFMQLPGHLAIRDSRRIYLHAANAFERNRRWRSALPLTNGFGYCHCRFDGREQAYAIRKRLDDLSVRPLLRHGGGFILLPFRLSCGHGVAGLGQRGRWRNADLG